jgi:RNA polymerase sigma factor (sigma-70 family)
MNRRDWNCDEVLIEAIQRGDGDAAACLYHRHIDRVHRICYRIVLDPSQVPDCVQEVWLKVFRSLGRFRCERSFVAWLNSATANTAIDYYRRWKRQGARVLVDENASQLIVQARPQHMSEMVALIQQLDVANVSQPAAQYLACRVFMLEIPSKDQSGKPFAVVLQADPPVSSQDMLEAIKGEDLQIAQLLQGTQWTSDGTPRILIKGLAASNEAVRRMIQKTPNSTISELKWGDETFAAVVPVAQLSQLPEQLQQHLRKFLGQDIQTVGYWFGNLSFPGEVIAPVGPWVLQLKARTAQAADIHVEIEVTQPPQLGVDSPTSILSNSLEGRIGKPIIIGYNRDSYGTRIMGALVIIPEADTQPVEGQSKAP